MKTQCWECGKWIESHREDGNYCKKCSKFVEEMRR